MFTYYLRPRLLTAANWPSAGKLTADVAGQLWSQARRCVVITDPQKLWMLGRRPPECRLVVITTGEAPVNTHRVTDYEQAWNLAGRLTSAPERVCLLTDLDDPMVGRCASARVIGGRRPPLTGWRVVCTTALSRGWCAEWVNDGFQPWRCGGDE